MTAAQIGAIVVIFSTLGIALWDEDNEWKRWLLSIVMIIAVLVLRVSERSEAKVEGIRDGVCAVYSGLDGRDDITVKNIPDYCK